MSTPTFKLRELEPRFIKRTDEGWCEVDTKAEAEGILFLCPKCFYENKGAIGTHSVLCWRPLVPPVVAPSPGRWEMAGEGLDDLSLVAHSSSILLTSGCRWHGFVKNGEVLSC